MWTTRAKASSIVQEPLTVGFRQAILPGMRSLAALTASAALALSACGEADGTTKPTIRNAGLEKWTEQQVIDAAGLRSENGISYETASGCSVAVILTTTAEVELYAGAG